jgi:sugar lactone lactonase YvrE
VGAAVIARYIGEQVSDERAILGESPIWDGTNLRWVDTVGKKLCCLGPGGVSTSTTLSASVNALALTSERLLLAVTSTSLGWLDEATGEVTERISVITDEALELNDGAVDVSGRYWFGSATTDLSPRGSLYRFADGRVEDVVDNIIQSNGIDWSPGATLLYHVDSNRGTVTEWRFNAETGAIGQPRVLRRVEPVVGLPDGLTVGADGRIWVALWGAGEVWALDPESGETTAVVAVPTSCVTSCAFGSSALDTLYITTAESPDDARSGLLYAAHVDATGTASHRFAGEL